MQGKRQYHGSGRERNRSASRHPQPAFTLVELLVVIAIIGILTALLLGAVMGALTTGRQAAIVASVNQMATALEDYKNNVGSYPPNAQSDSNAAYPHLDNSRVLTAFKQHMKKAFPNHREPSELIEALVGAHDGTNGVRNLQGGMNAAEALVFWLGGFSDDPEYPITGAGGPSYSVTGANGAAANEEDALNRNWLLEIPQQQLGPRLDNDYFDQTDGRYITYVDPRDGATQRRINFWFLKARNSPAPFVYFDASRGSSATARNDPPAATKDYAQFTGSDAEALNELFNVHAIKTRKTDAGASIPYRFASEGKFQVLHAGVDEDWGIFPMVNPNPPADPDNVSWLINCQPWHNNGDNSVVLALTHPEGPWTQELADTIASYVNGTLEDAQP